MKILRYRPAFFEGFESKDDTLTFKTKEELLAIDWIKSWETPANDDKFSGFFVSRNLLMVTYNYNTSKEPQWYVIATLPDKETIDMVSSWFPKWDTPEYVMKNGDVIDVTSWCVGNITYVVNGSRDEQKGTEEWLYQNMQTNRFPRITFKSRR